MTGVQKLGVLLVVLGLLYVGWLRRSSKRASTADPSSGAVASGPAAEQIAGRVRRDASGPPPALVLAWVQGTYVDTTMATSRHDRVAGSWLGSRHLQDAARVLIEVDSLQRIWPGRRWRSPREQHL